MPANLRQNAAVAAVLIIDGKEYPLVDGEPVDVESVPTQPGEMETEWERRIYNAGRGWGESRWAGPGGYDYTYGAVLHRPMSFFNRPSVTVHTSIGLSSLAGTKVHFSEYWDGVDANRRLVVTTARHIYEVKPDGTVSTADLGSSFTLARGMAKAVRYKNSAMSSPKMYVARPSTNTADYMVERTGDGTYAVSANNKYAASLAVGKDPDGEDIIWRVTENGKLNASLADTNPSNSANWAGATYPAGEGSVQINDMFQQAGALLIGRHDGVWTFDNVLNTIPITPMIGGALSRFNCQWMKDFNGMALVPTEAGLLWIDGLEWGTAGPITTVPSARNLRGVEVAASVIAGNYVYAAVFDSETSISHIFMGEPRELRGEGTGRGPLIWHGPIGGVGGASGRVTDLHVSTVWGRKLWIGLTDVSESPVSGAVVMSIDLDSDFAPIPSNAEWTWIYLPEGIFDMSGPGVIKEFRKAEFIAPASRPFSAVNRWTLELETTPGSDVYTPIDGGYAESGVVVDRYWTTETSGKRIRARLNHTSTDGNGIAELEQVIVRGTERPETTDQYTFVVDARDAPKKFMGTRVPRSGYGTVDNLRQLLDLGRTTTIVWGEESFTGKVVRVQRKTSSRGERAMPTHALQVVIRKVKLS